MVKNSKTTTKIDQKSKSLDKDEMDQNFISSTSKMNQKKTKKSQNNKSDKNKLKTNNSDQKNLSESKTSASKIDKTIKNNAINTAKATTKKTLKATLKTEQIKSIDAAASVNSKKAAKKTTQKSKLSAKASKGKQSKSSKESASQDAKSKKQLAKKTQTPNISDKPIDIDINSKDNLPKSIRHILISQPEPTTEKSPYHELAKKYKLKFTFIPFLNVESVSLREFRKSKINIADYTTIIFNSKNAIDYFFRICEEMRHKMPQEAKYICSSEAIALYLQKYIQYRKRKVIYTDGTPEEMQNVLKKYHNDKFLLPCSAYGIGYLPVFLKNNKFDYTEAIMYKMVPNESLKNSNLNYDFITFFNPEGVKAFLSIFPDFKKQNIAIGAFGAGTQEELKRNGINIHAIAPYQEIKSMVMAIEKFIKDNINLVELQK